MQKDQRGFRRIRIRGRRNRDSEELVGIERPSTRLLLPALKRKAQVQDIPGVQALDHRKKEEDAARAKIKERGQLRVGDGSLSAGGVEESSLPRGRGLTVFYYRLNF